MKRIMVMVIVVMLPCAGTVATLRVPSQYADIQAAIDASSNGDTIQSWGSIKSLFSNEKK